MTSCSKAKQRTIFANSVRFAQRCRELLAIEYRNNPGIVEIMSPRLHEEIVSASKGQKSPAKLLMMRLAPSPRKVSPRSIWSRIFVFFKTCLILSG